VPDLDLDTLASVLAGLLADRLADRLAALVAKRYLSVADAAIYASLSPDSIRSLLNTGKLSGLRPVGGRVLIDRRELDALLLASTRRPRRGRGLYDRAGAGQTKGDSAD
jgi:excisionase family DNA binding protein